MKGVFCKLKDSVSSASHSKSNPPGFGPSESQVEFSLQFPQPPRRKPSNAESFYEFDTLTGKMKDTSMALGGAHDLYEDDVY